MTVHGTRLVREGRRNQALGRQINFGGIMKKDVAHYVWRSIAVLVFCAVLIATCLSLHANPQPKWFDWVAAAPVLYIIFSLAFFKNDSALVEELDSILARIKRAFSKTS